MTVLNMLHRISVMTIRPLSSAIRSKAKERNIKGTLSPLSQQDTLLGSKSAGFFFSNPILLFSSVTLSDLGFAESEIGTRVLLTLDDGASAVSSNFLFLLAEEFDIRTSNADRCWDEDENMVMV